MRVTPLDIRKQEFRKGMRGLDADEVYAFLNTVADEYEAVLSDNKNLREKMVELEARLSEYRSIETNLRNTLVTAEKLTQEAKENAKREAALLIREAEMEAEKAAETIRAHTNQLRREIFELKKNKDAYVTRLKTLLDTHRKMLDGFQEDFAGVDQAIEKIGQQVEEDARKGAAPPRMSREKITQEFAHETKDKVTWGEERRREDEQRPSMPKPSWETREEPNQRTKPAEDASLFGATAGAAGPGPEPQASAERQSEERPGDADVHRTIARGIEQKLYPDVDMSQQPGSVRAAQSAPQQAPSAAAPQPRQDDWRQYEVRKQPVDWRSYEVQSQRPQPQVEAEEQQSAVATETEVESALSSLKEATQPAQAPAQARPQTQQGAPRPEAAERRAPEGAPQASQPQPGAPVGAEQTWSMEDLRRNLTNLANNEGDKR